MTGQDGKYDAQKVGGASDGEEEGSCDTEVLFGAAAQAEGLRMHGAAVHVERSEGELSGGSSGWETVDGQGQQAADGDGGYGSDTGAAPTVHGVHAFQARMPTAAAAAATAAVPQAAPASAQPAGHEGSAHAAIKFGAASAHGAHMTAAPWGLPASHFQQPGSSGGVAAGSAAMRTQPAASILRSPLAARGGAAASSRADHGTAAAAAGYAPARSSGGGAPDNWPPGDQECGRSGWPAAGKGRSHDAGGRAGLYGAAKLPRGLQHEPHATFTKEHASPQQQQQRYHDVDDANGSEEDESHALLKPSCFASRGGAPPSRGTQHDTAHSARWPHAQQPAAGAAPAGAPSSMPSATSQQLFTSIRSQLAALHTSLGHGQQGGAS